MQHEHTARGHHASQQHAGAWNRAEEKPRFSHRIAGSSQHDPLCGWSTILEVQQRPYDLSNFLRARLEVLHRSVSRFESFAAWTTEGVIMSLPHCQVQDRIIR
jgi:hypothetical protein